MSKKGTIRIGLLGFGVVGQGVWKNIKNNHQALEHRLGAKIEITEVVVRSLEREREVKLPDSVLSVDPARVVDNADIDIVCELMGGTDIALDLTRRALKMGKIVVTANKALICEHGEELFNTARESGGKYFYEASVAGGIPIIKTIQEALVANRFSLIFGILNGTSNYILTRMEREGISFDSTLADARKLGYVEADESLDLDGIDAAHKLTIMSAIAFGIPLQFEKTYTEGISGISPADISFAEELGYRIKHLGIARKTARGVEMRVHPTLVSSTSLLANVNGVGNAVMVQGNFVGSTPVSYTHLTLPTKA